MKSREAPDLDAVTAEIIGRLGRDCKLLEQSARKSPRQRLRSGGNRTNPIETLVEGLMTRTAFPVNSPPRFSPRELRERSFDRLASAGFDTSAKRKRLAEALVSSGLVRRLTLAWLGAAKTGAVVANLGKMFGKEDEGGRIVGLPAYGAELAGQIFDSPALLRRYLQSDEQAFVLMMEGGGTHPILLNMPNLAVLLVSLHASNVR